MRKIYSAVALAAVASLALAACGQPDDSGASSPSGSGTKSDFKACMVSDAGGFDDRSFNQSTYEGLERAGKNLNIETQALESTDMNDFNPNLETLIASDCDLIITVGFVLSDATAASAEANPGLKYAIVDDNAIEKDNVKPVVYSTQEAAFLAGYAAAAYSTTGKVGTFGGMKIPTVTIFMDGFADGVARYNADKGKKVEVIGWDKEKQDGLFTGDFDDVAKGKTMAETIISQGADVIMPVAGPVGGGAAAAAKDKGGVAIVWVDADGFETTEYGDIMLTSVMKLMGEAVENIVKETMDGNFSPADYIGTLSNDGVGIAPWHDFDSKVSQETKDEIDALKAAIISGELKVESASAPKTE